MADRYHAISCAMRVLYSTWLGLGLGRVLYSTWLRLGLGRVLYSTWLGLGLGRVLYSTCVAREVAWHLSATVGSTLLCQFIEPVTFAFIFALRNIVLGRYLDTRRNI